MIALLIAPVSPRMRPTRSPVPLTPNSAASMSRTFPKTSFCKSSIVRWETLATETILPIKNKPRATVPKNIRPINQASVANGVSGAYFLIHGTKASRAFERVCWISTSYSADDTCRFKSAIAGSAAGNCSNRNSKSVIRCSRSAISFSDLSASCSTQSCSECPVSTTSTKG